MTKDENGVTSMQIVAVSIVLGAILALIRGSVVLANANAGPDVTSALVLTTPVLTFFFSALLRVEHFSFREVNREHPENVMKVLAILFVTISVAVVCSYKGALMFGDPKEYEAPNVVVGAIWMLTNTLASSVAIVMQKMIINAKIPIEVVNAAMTGIGAFWLLIVGLIAHGTAKDIWTLSSDGLYAVLFGAFFPSAMNLIIFAKSSKLLGPNITARYFLLQPAMTWALDYLVLKDAVYESYVICAVFSAMAMMSFASANSFVRNTTSKKEEEREEEM
jgi:drug/metabolite transporter (DMT)-like permease